MTNAFRRTSLSLLALVFVLLANQSLAQAQVSGFTQVETTLNHPYQGLAVYTGIDEKLGEYWKLSSFFLVTNGWGEGYVGPTYSLGTNFALNFSFGVEQGKTGLTPRYATSLWLMSDKLWFLGILEGNSDLFHGDDSGVWYDLNLMYQLNDNLAFGLKDRRPVGVGPAVQVSTHGVDFWLQWAVSSSEQAQFCSTCFLGGVKRSF